MTVTTRLEGATSLDPAIEAIGPTIRTAFVLTTGVLEEGNQRFYRRAGYRLVTGEHTPPGAVDFAKPRR